MLHNFSVSHYRYILIALVFSYFNIVVAQEPQVTKETATQNGECKMAVVEFKKDEKDGTANRSGTIVLDQNGKKCALIKIETTEHNFSYDVGMSGVVKVVPQNAEHPAEIWLYVPEKVRKIELQHAVFGKCEYDFGFRLKSATTYRLKLVTTGGRVKPVIIDYTKSQYLKLNVFPKNATVFIQGRIEPLNNGVAEVPLAFGNYPYRIVAPDFHEEEGYIEINNPDNPHVLDIRLKQAFGYLNVGGNKEYDGADIFIDDKLIGKYPIQKTNLKSGNHKIMIKKKLYEPYLEEISMTDSASVILNPKLKENYSVAKVIVNNSKDAQIYVDGELVGTGQWSGRIEAGKHIIEARKASHRPTRREVLVVKNQDLNIPLMTPTPIYGKLEITTIPRGADVYIDGKLAGHTELNLQDILVGGHVVEIKKKGYRTEKRNVTVEEGDVKRINVPMTDYCEAKLNTSPWAYLYINGESRGTTPYQLKEVAGEYKIELRRRGYTTYTKKMKLNGQTSDMNISLHRDLTRRNEFYMQCGYNVLGLQGLTAGLGFYISNFNFEGNYVLSFSESEKIFWTKGSYTLPTAFTYKPSGYNGKVGYGIKLSSRFRLTPQLGCQVVMLKEEHCEDDYFYSDSYATQLYEAVTNATSISGTIGLRLSFAVAPCVGLAVSPEYWFPISQSGGYKTLSELSSKIKGYGEGLACNISVNIFF